MNFVRTNNRTFIADYILSFESFQRHFRAKHELEGGPKNWNCNLEWVRVISWPHGLFSCFSFNMRFEVSVANESHTISHAGSKLVDRMLSSVTLIIPRQLFKRTHQGPVNSKSFIEKGKVALCWKFFLLNLCKNYFRLDLLIFRCGAANDVQ